MTPRMTPRERFAQTMSYGRPDRVPWLEEGLRDDVLQAWQAQGLPPGSDLGSLFHYDHRERMEVDLGPRPALDHAPCTWGDVELLRQRLDADDPGRLPRDWAQRVAQWQTRGHLLDLSLHPGLFLLLGVHDWASLEPVLYLLAEQPDLVRAIMDVHAGFIARMAERILSQVQVDFVSFSEPISDNHGPLVSPAMYRRVVLDSERPIFQVLRGHRVPTIVFMTYGNARLLLPDVLAAGFNCLWAMETETTAMDYLDLRRRFGKDLRLIGGIDLDALLRDESAIEQEVLAKRPLLEEGGYIPLADGRVRATMRFDRYQHYRRVLEKLTVTRT